jgi:hypothetical protein
MTHLIENDTDTEKSGLCPSSTSTSCPLITAEKQVKGFPWDWTLTTVDCKGFRVCCNVLSAMLQSWFSPVVFPFIWAVSCVLIPSPSLKTTLKKIDLVFCLLARFKYSFKNYWTVFEMNFFKAARNICNHIDHQGIFKRVLTLNFLLLSHVYPTAYISLEDLSRVSIGRLIFDSTRVHVEISFYTYPYHVL